MSLFWFFLVRSNFDWKEAYSRYSNLTKEQLDFIKWVLAREEKRIEYEQKKLERELTKAKRRLR